MGRPCLEPRARRGGTTLLASRADWRTSGVCSVLPLRPRCNGPFFCYLCFLSFMIATTSGDTSPVQVVLPCPVAGGGLHVGVSRPARRGAQARLRLRSASRDDGWRFSFFFSAAARPRSPARAQSSTVGCPTARRVRRSRQASLPSTAVWLRWIRTRSRPNASPRPPAHASAALAPVGRVAFGGRTCSR